MGLRSVSIRVRLSRQGSKVASAAFASSTLMFAMTPNAIGHQDIASFIARQPVVAERWRQHVIASPFGAIHAATFSFPRPLGTAMPDATGYSLASLNPRDPDITGSIGDRAFFDRAEPSSAAYVFPSVNRALKGDLLVPRALLVPEPEPQLAPEQKHPGKRPALADEGIKEKSSEIAYANPAPRLDAAFPAPPEAMQAEPVEQSLEADDTDSRKAGTANEQIPAVTVAHLFFGLSPMGAAASTIEPWASGQQPTVLSPETLDPDIRLAALTAQAGGQTIAGKGEVTGTGRAPKSPAERLGLTGKTRAKAEKCLTEAIYFEARGEPERGQKAVAQVVINRVFSGYYPDNVCGVVYQNAHRHLACQFTFACDGIPDRVTEPDLWAKAKRIARHALDGKTWLPEVGKATHYHANYVHPWWVRTMRKHQTIGVHIFYRPRKWGDGAEIPVWGEAAATEEKSKSASAGETEKKL